MIKRRRTRIVDTIHIPTSNTIMCHNIYSNGYLEYFDIYTYMYNRPEDTLSDYIVSSVKLIDSNRLIHSGSFKHFKSFLYQEIPQNLFDQIKNELNVARVTDVYDGMLISLFCGRIRVPVNANLELYLNPRLEFTTESIGKIEIVGCFNE